MAVLSNCLFWAWRTWRREGGHLTICRSVHGWWWHFGVLQDGRMRYYYPERPPGDTRCPPPLFRGRVVEGDYLQGRPE